MSQPRWLEFAWGDLGVAEIAGARHNARVVRTYAEVGHPEVTDDETAWCAAFLGACLERSGIRSTRSLMARSYLTWGMPAAEPTHGAIAVLSRGFDPRLGHVGFLVGATSADLILLGGNQGDAVSVQAFPRSRLLALRWPSSVIPGGASAPTRDPAPDAPLGDLFERALAHVLEMEGGYDDDPYDPGGPTNMGITLAEFARDRGIEVTASNLAALKAELKAIPRDTVRRLYRDRYWLAASCPDLPPPLALFHFDAAVNQGLARAARLLQQSVGTDIDGEIGPLTLAAVAAQPIDKTLAVYAELRRQHYRGLGHFWRFGKGWLRRVDATLDLARQIARTMPIGTTSPQPKENSAMPIDTHAQTTTEQQNKWWGQSLTIWGVIVTTLSTVLPVIGPALGLSITPDLVHQIGDHVVAVVQALGGLIGTVLTVYGRVRATTPLERRQVTLNM